MKRTANDTYLLKCDTIYVYVDVWFSVFAFSFLAVKSQQVWRRVNRVMSNELAVISNWIIFRSVGSSRLVANIVEHEIIEFLLTEKCD